MDKILKQAFHRRDIQVVSKYRTMSSISFSIKEMQVKASTHNVILAQCLKLKRLTLPTVGEVGQLKLSDIVSRSGNLFNNYGKFYGSFYPS